MGIDHRQLSVDLLLYRKEDLSALQKVGPLRSRLKNFVPIA